MFRFGWNKMETEELVRPALGRVASIGDLYDARTDNFCGTNLFKNTLPVSVIRVTDNPSTDIQFIQSDTYNEKFDKLDIEGELKISILAGLFSVGGSGKYLTSQKKSDRDVSSSLIYKIHTKVERINLFREEIIDCFSMDALSLKNATHVVVEVGWGANSTITMERRSKNNEDVKQIKGELQGQLERLSGNLSGKCGVDNTTRQENKQENYKLHVFGDIMPTDEVIPQTFDDALNFMKGLPQLVQSANDGKGKPLKYMMMPLTTLQTYLKVSFIEDRIIESISKQSIIRFVKLFEDISGMKQQLYDLHKNIYSHKHCVPYERIESIDNLKNRVESAEASLRSKLAKLLVEVRYGNAGAEVLESLMEETVSGDLSSNKIRKFIDSCSDIIEKIHFIEKLTKEGVTYIGKGNGTSLEMVKMENVTGETYVLFFNESEKGNNSTLQNLSDNKQHFLRMLKSEQEQSVNLDTANKDHQKCIKSFVAVDLQMRPELVKQEGIKPASRICLFKNGRYISSDVLSEHMTVNERCLVKYSSDKKQLATTKPKKRVILKLRCPGSLSGYCDKQEHSWSCCYCKKSIEHGFDGYFYCNCGKAPYDCYQFMCNSDSRGAKYLNFKKKELNQLLSKIEPTEMNILILGEIGVGKSTWINGLVNYMTYKSLDEAAKNKSVCVIETSFTMNDENFKQREIKTGTDPNEVMNKGQSATQSPKSYVIDWGNTSVRLIDTPGIGDTRGIYQDKKNFDEILSYIAYYPELHGICILLKPNNSRLTVMFQFCIKELLTHLNKSACDNIVFCFTNARSTFYRPGDTLPALRCLLEENKNVEIELSKHTIYCLDNESFRFLCAIHNGVQFNHDETHNFSVSWDKSVSETNRLFEHFNGLKPHSTKDTISLNDARKVILNLTRPMAEISKNIQTNIAIIRDKEEEILNSKLGEKDLLDKLYVPQIGLEPKALESPTTVCTSLSCVRYHTIPGTKEMTIEYVTHCHVSCGLKGVKKDSYPNADLKNCTAMDENFNCKHCKCSWDCHMHVDYEYNQNSKNVIDQTVQNLINSKKSDVDKVNTFILEMENEIYKLKKEQEQITNVNVMFGCFLKANAISPYNDALKEYLEVLIKQEKEKVNAGGDQTSLKGLEEMLNDYIEEVHAIEMSLTKDDNAKSLTPNDIYEMVGTLFSLPINGKQLKDIMEVSLASGNRMLVQYTETRYRPQEPPVDKKSKRPWYSIRK